MDEISIKIDEKSDIDIDKPHNDKLLNNNPHNDKPVTKIEISPNEKYLVTYSPEDNSIAGWNVKYSLKLDNILDLSDRNVQIKRDLTNDESESNKTLYQISVSDDKEVAFINDENKIEIYHMNNSQEIILDCGYYCDYVYCTFNVNGELILYGSNHTVFIYSTQTNNKKWNCKRVYKLFKDPEDFKFITISKYNKLYLFSNNSIYKWNLDTEKSIKILIIDEEIEGKDWERKKYIENNIEISSNEKFICTRVKNEIIIYSVELEIPIASLDINNVTQLRNLIKYPALRSRLFPLLCLLFSNKICSGFWDSVKGWKKCLGHSKQNDKLLTKCDISVRATNKLAFVIQDGDIWKVDLEKMILYINSLPINNSDEIINKEMDKTYNHLNIFLLISYNSYMDTINYKGIKLQVIKKNNINNRWDLICTRDEKFKVDYGIEPFEMNLFNDNEIIILTNVGLLIYHFNENDKTISLNYYYYMKFNKINHSRDLRDLRDYRKEFSKSTLPLPKYNSFAICDGWASVIKNNKEYLLKYGIELLNSAIKERDLELVDQIYKICLNHFEKDFRNKMFLSIITSTMPLLNEYYPEYIEKFSLETTMIIDSPSYSIEHQSSNLHLFSFQYPHMVNLSRSILWFKYNELMSSLLENHERISLILNSFQFLIILLTFPIYFITFYILSYFNFIDDLITYGLFSEFYFKIVSFSSNYKRIPTITFINPYIKFVNYSKHYNWFTELILPKPSPFVETINRDIYRTWSGEAILNFKWNKYGKYYHLAIWFGYIILLICFNIAAKISQEHVDIQRKLLITSITLGSMYLILEIRQFIYDPTKWIQDIGNILVLFVYIIPICTSIWCLHENDHEKIIPYITFSCLLLNLKLISFFRIFENYDAYYTIVVRIAKRVMFFFVYFIMIILTSFAFAFHILLSPKMNYSLDKRIINDDPNNPWNMAPTYQVFDNETSIDSNIFILQTPDENTNMFTTFSTSFFATCSLLTGDTSSFYNWPYEDNPTLMILLILFAFIMAIYILNYLAKIELFYLLPHQRRWKEWFPEVIYYHANVDETRKKVREMIDNRDWKTNVFPDMKIKLLKKLNIDDYITNKPVDEFTLRKVLKETKTKL
ncbi:hypothetical protein RhiirA4_467762 [Rhizophagus irregularis]|uniref:Ion transport domain-containing protein n=1 Tax=Rhizophagus irregularis TaxID=588596 RepID=A0A2I1GWQ6_9GLOM|nr:hypothetical protein RhiirA4_467762 [Rhizophagus irregularis]